jgi:hypothetical protein
MRLGVSLSAFGLGLTFATGPVAANREDSGQLLFLFKTPARHHCLEGRAGQPGRECQWLSCLNKSV